MTHWLCLSPHFDDIALSLGGWAWQQVENGNTVEIWTICAGDAPPDGFSAFAESLHTRWKTGAEAVARRREEDRRSCGILRAHLRHFHLPDCIYRAHPENQYEFLYASETAIFGEIHPAETPRLRELAATLQAALPASAEIVCPMALGGHVDHRLTRAAAELLARPLWYYADYPYVLREAAALQHMSAAWVRHTFPLSEAALIAWNDAVAAHASQVGTFWRNAEIMRSALREYAQTPPESSLWRAPKNI
ncbi:MAG: hypothetical protein OHK0052_13750 [Anaerolineales bacterium]